MLRDQEMAQMDADGLRSYIDVLHQALSLHARANDAAARIISRTRGMNRQVNRMSADNPMMQLARALAGGAR